MPNTEITDDYIKNAILSTTSTGAYLIKIIQDNNVCAILQGHNVSENYRFYVAFSYYNIGYVNKIKTFKLRLEEWTIETYITNTDLQVKRYDVPQPTPGSIFSSFGVWGCRVLKSGKVVTIQINVDGSMVANYNFNVLFTLPVEYRPMVDVISNYVTQKGTPMLLNILGTGEFVLNNLNVAINDSWICRQQIVYITDK